MNSQEEQKMMSSVEVVWEQLLLQGAAQKLSGE
jgi:hypothetical protein